MDWKEMVFWSIVVLSISSIILGCTWINHLSEEEYVKGGYTRTVMPGKSRSVWVKPKVESLNQQYVTALNALVNRVSTLEARAKQKEVSRGRK